MPCIEMYTTLSADKVPANFFDVLTEFFCGLLDKNPRGVVLNLYTDQRIHTGSDLNATMLMIQIYNAEAWLDHNANREAIKLVTDKVTGILGIPPDRSTVLLITVPSHQVGTPGGNLLADRDQFKWRLDYIKKINSAAASA
ncbi:uncharacterized protein LOC129257438 [Lytechinus pictus]|uniref:uncharacterized protein LOC129257438 n=1 Tax=Lytechinus pictus TaxID=7653 RepID=UPI0030B9F407